MSADFLIVLVVSWWSFMAVVAIWPYVLRRRRRVIDWQHIADMERDIYGYVSVWVAEHLPAEPPLTLPGVSVPAPRLPRTLADRPPYQPRAYRVKPGDTLADIASTLDVSPDEVIIEQKGRFPYARRADQDRSR